MKVLRGYSLNKNQKIAWLACKLSKLKTPAVAKKYFADYIIQKRGKLVVRGWDGDWKTLQLHHKNGNRKDNSVNNLMFITANNHCKLHLKQRTKVFWYD